MADEINPSSPAYKWIPPRDGKPIPEIYTNYILSSWSNYDVRFRLGRTGSDGCWLHGGRARRYNVHMAACQNDHSSTVRPRSKLRGNKRRDWADKTTSRPYADEAIKERYGLPLLCSFPNDPSSGLAGILGLALVSVKGFLYAPAFSRIFKLEKASAF